MIDAMQAKSISEEAGRFRKIPRKFERKIENQIRNAAKKGLDHVCVMLFDIDGDMTTGIVDFLTGNGYGVVCRYMQDPRDCSETHQFMISWRHAR